MQFIYLKQKNKMKLDKILHFIKAAVTNDCVSLMKSFYRFFLLSHLVAKILQNFLATQFYAKKLIYCQPIPSTT